MVLGRAFVSNAPKRPPTFGEVEEMNNEELKQAPEQSDDDVLYRLTRKQVKEIVRDYGLIKTGVRAVQKHADDLYVGAHEQGFQGAGWAAHEIVKYLGMIERCNLSNMAQITLTPCEEEPSQSLSGSGEAVAWLKTITWKRSGHVEQSVHLDKPRDWTAHPEHQLMTEYIGSESIEPLYTAPQVGAVSEEMVERLAIHLATKESANFKTLDESINHVNNWKRLVPEARAALTAALSDMRGK